MQLKKSSTRKQELLESEGYQYNFLRQLYFNRAIKKALSIEFVEECQVENLETIVCEKGRGPEWQFFFNSSPAEEVKRELIHFLEACRSPTACAILHS